MIREIARMAGGQRSNKVHLTGRCLAAHNMWHLCRLNKERSLLRCGPMGSNNIDYRRPFPWILNGFFGGTNGLGTAGQGPSLPFVKNSSCRLR